MVNKPSSITNELAKERNRAAAERTLTAWINNCLHLIGFGIAFDRSMNAINQVLAGKYIAIKLQTAHIIGLTTIAIGVFLLILAIIGYVTEIRLLEQNNYLYKPSYFFISVLTITIIIFGFWSLLLITVK